MAKTKMRCNTCGKWFQSANAKDLTCPDCLQKARREKSAAKAAPPTANRPTTGQRTPPPPPKPKHTQSGTAQWLDQVSDVKVAQVEQPTRPKLPPSPPHDTRSTPGGYRDAGGPSIYREGANRGPGGYREGENRTSGPYRVGGGAGLPEPEQRPRHPMEKGFVRGPRTGGGEQFPGRPRPSGEGGLKEGKPGGKPKAKTPKPLPAPKPKHEKIPPPKPFEPTPEQLTQVQTRYLELATPTEFDGIRTQIAHELDIPKKAVKKIIKELRESQHIPSWWEAQTFKGNEEELAKIRTAYEPLLPLPEVGIHKKIAEQLGLKAGDVYQAIKTIRAEMNLPQYNNPALHGLELEPVKKKESDEQQEVATTQETPDAPHPAPVPTDSVETTDTATVVSAKQEEQA